MVMEPTRPVEMMDAEGLVELAPLARHVVAEVASVHPTVLEDSVETTDVEVHLVENAHPHRLVPTVSVLELPLLIVQVEDSVEVTERVETVVYVDRVKDAEVESVNVTTTVTKETVETQSNLKEPTPDCAPKDLVEPVPVVLLAAAVDDVQLSLRVMSASRLLIVPLIRESQQAALCSSPQLL